MGQVGSLYSSLTLESSSFVSGLKKAADATAKNTGEMKEHLEGLHETLDTLKEGFERFAEFEALRFLKEQIEDGLEYAASLGEVSQQIGITTRDLQTYRYAASQYGISTEEMDGAMQKFTKTLGAARAGNKEAAGAFLELGVSMQEIKEGDPHDVFLKSADGISQIRDRANRATPELALFGKTGQQLDPLLSQGSAGINNLARAAEDLGIVLSKDQIEHADRAADKIAELKMVLSSQIASIVADDAQAIYGMAEALEHLIGKLENFNDRLAQVHDRVVEGMEMNKAGIWRGLTLGIPNAFANGRATQADQAAANARADYDKHEDAIWERSLPYSIRELPTWAQPSEKEGAGNRHYTDPAAADAAAKAREKAQREAEEAARKAQERAKKLEQYHKRVDDQEASLDDNWLSTREGMTADVTERAKLQRQQLDADTAAKLKAADDQAKIDIASGLNADMVNANRDTVKSLIQRNADLKADEINRTENMALDKEAQQLADDKLGYLRDDLEAQESMAVTAKDRLAIALRLLDAEKENERQKLQAIADDANRDVDHQRYTDADHKSAQIGLSTLDARYGQKADQARLQNASPIEAYRRQLLESTSDMNAALQGVAVDGLKQMEDGLAGIVTGTETVSKAFTSMAQSILSDLAKIAIEKEVIGPLANSLFGGGAISGDVGTFANDNVKGLIDTGAPLSLDGARAGGGPVDASGLYLVGEQGPELFVPDSAGTIISNKGLASVGGGASGPVVHQTIQFAGATDLATRTEMYRFGNAIHKATIAAMDDRARRRA